MIEFMVEGTPRPQGSKRSVGNNRFIEASKYIKGWRQAVHAAALTHAPAEPLDGPLSTILYFRFERGKTVKRARHTVRPDLSKLIRAVEDSLVTARVIKDDSNIIRTYAEKAYADSGELPGVTIKIKEATS